MPAVAQRLRFGARWLRALPATVRDALPVRRSRSTFEAALAAFAPVLRLRGIDFTSLSCGLMIPWYHHIKSVDTIKSR